MQARAASIERLRALRPHGPARTAFAGLFAATFLCFLAIGAVLPALPRYVKGPMGAGDIAVGVVMGAFALTALVGRPLGGRIADRRGRKLVFCAGLLFCVAAGALLFLPSVPGLIFARFIVGIGDGWVFTAGVTWIVDLAPDHRRGQAIGIYGLSIWGGLTLGAILGEGAYALGGYSAVWILASVGPLLGLAVASVVPEVRRERREDAQPVLAAPQVTGFASPRARGLGGWIPRESVRPGIALGLANIGYGTMGAFIVLLLDWRGIGHGAIAFVAFSGALLLTRAGLSRLPDQVGARMTVLVSGVLEGLGLIGLAAAQSLPVALAAAALMGVGMSLIFPALATLTVEGVVPERRGAALGGFTAFFDIGFGLGAPLSGLIVSLGDGGNYPAAFAASGVLAFLGALIGWRSTRQPVVPTYA
ncbi:unannotated protein [freshwater metagenome]|uniref:Unannotated protein n=1 Tax=freshwater metagenome TaxID=449393 RepID=A0A6J7DSX7_9ZZZZ